MFRAICILKSGHFRHSRLYNGYLFRGWCSRRHECYLSCLLLLLTELLQNLMLIELPKLCQWSSYRANSTPVQVCVYGDYEHGWKMFPYSFTPCALCRCAQRGLPQGGPLLLFRRLFRRCRMSHYRFLPTRLLYLCGAPQAQPFRLAFR